MLQCLHNKLDESHACRLGVFGNKLATWSRPDQVPLSKRQGLSLRGLKPGMPFIYNVDFKTIVTHWNEYYYVCETDGDVPRLFQGEITRGLSGYELWFGNTSQNLREAMKDPSFMTGVLALEKIRAYASLKSFTQIMDCLDLHSDCIVEFTCYGRDIGDTVGCNTIIWEVRAGY